MFEHRFRQEVFRLPPFQASDVRDQRVWAADFPAWRALFTAMCLFGHSTGYRLPSHEQFHDYCRRAYCTRHPDAARFTEFFDGELAAGMWQRTGAWYESGMAETYLYVCLVEAIEDRGKLGLVLYDPRADWKLKADMIVLLNGSLFRVSAFFGDQSGRSQVEARRDVIERVRKRNTMESAHWGNAQLQHMHVLEIARTPSDLQVINGLRLFSVHAVNGLLANMYSLAGVNGWHF